VQRRSDTRGWAVVTGASSGLGYEFALALSARGHPVLAVARRGDRLSQLAEAALRRGGVVEPLVADLARSDGVDAVVATATQHDVDLLINNAGVASYGRFADADPERQRELVRVNIEAVVVLTSRMLPAMVERGQGGVINIASQMALQPMPYFAAYAASKAFVVSFSEALAAELRGTGVRVTAVAPGFVRTEFAAVAGSEAPERRFPHLRPEHVVAAALRAHERGRVIKVVGPLYVFLTAAGRFAPRPVLRRMMEVVMRPRADAR
jgi:short-subunit dehydrogenase